MTTPRTVQWASGVHTSAAAVEATAVVATAAAASPLPHRLRQCGAKKLAAGREGERKNGLDPSRHLSSARLG